MQALPGLTPAAIWDLPYVEFLIVAEFADRWAEQQRDLARRTRRTHGTTHARR